MLESGPRCEESVRSGLGEVVDPGRRNPPVSCPDAKLESGRVEARKERHEAVDRLDGSELDDEILDVDDPDKVGAGEQVECGMPFVRTAPGQEDLRREEDGRDAKALLVEVLELRGTTNEPVSVPDPTKIICFGGIRVHSRANKPESVLGLEPEVTGVDQATGDLEQPEANERELRQLLGRHQRDDDCEEFNRQGEQRCRRARADDGR